MSAFKTIPSSAFYGEYNGHRVEHLQIVHDAIRSSKSSTDAGIIFLAGDSTLDNKYWFTDRAPALNGYEKVLQPPTSVKDVAYWLNYEAVNRGLGEKLTALNCAVEATTISDRSSKLLPADRFIRDNIRPNDTLVLSLGGNDVALKPSLGTIISMLLLLRCAPKCFINCSFGRALPSPDCCSGCLSNLCAFPLGYGHFLHLFGTQIQAIASRLISGAHKPKRVLVCMVYFLDTLRGNSWAERALDALGYNDDPHKLQAAIRRLFEHATSRIRLPGTEVVPVPLFAALDGSQTEMYVQRVEPSAAGGARLATLIMDGVLDGAEGVRLSGANLNVAAAAPGAAGKDSEPKGPPDQTKM